MSYTSGKYLTYGHKYPIILENIYPLWGINRHYMSYIAPARVYPAIFIFAFLASYFFGACEGNVPEKTTTIKLPGGNGVKILVIDSCEYIVALGGSSGWGTHKGNCKFCTERNIKILQSLGTNSHQ